MLLYPQFISEEFPDTKLSVIRKTEKLFLEGDTNGDGVRQTDFSQLSKINTNHKNQIEIFIIIAVYIVRNGVMM